MQRRLTVALVGVALASVALVGAGVLVLAQIGARQQTETEAIERLDFLAELVEPTRDTDPDRPSPGGPLARAIPVLGLSEAELAIVEQSGVMRTLRVVGGDRRRGPGLEPDGGAIALGDQELVEFLNGDVVVLDGGGSEVRVLRAIAGDGSTPDGAGGTLALVVSRPVVTISREARLWFIASAAIVLAGSLVASWFLARRFVVPIRRIEQATAAVAAGDFSARVELAGDDELAELGRSVNRMTADLERSKALDQQFLLSISHDLRTPLTAIGGYAEALKDGAITDPARTGVVIANHADRLERLVGDLLDLARLDANQFRLHLQSVDAGVAVGRTVAGLVPQAERHGLALRFHNHGPTIVRADPDRLAQTVANLVDNGLKFASSAVDVSVSPSGSDAVVTVDDDGPGIVDDDLPHIFDRLYVSRSQPARAENPSGMGLAIVRELVTAMGGSVSAGSGPAGGTRMTVRLPLETPQQTTEIPG